MSSSSAMNRRIARDSNSTSSSNQEPISIQGTPLQQQYKILNLHERRLNLAYDQIHKLTKSFDTLEPNVNLRIHRLEQENASLRKQMASIMSKVNSLKESNSVALSISED